MPHRLNLPCLIRDSRTCSALTLLAVIDRIDNDGGVLTSTTPLLQLAADLATQHEISIYDATYAAAAISSGSNLISCDHRDLVSKGLAQSP